MTTETVMPTEELPKHVAIIMDGNRRWAVQKDGSPAIVGHHAGYLALKQLLQYLVHHSGVEILTVYAFSIDNWKRSKEEVDGIMSLAVALLTSDLPELHSYGACIKILGDRETISPELRDAILKAESKTANNSKFQFVIALNYGGSWDITEGFKRFASLLSASQNSDQTLPMTDKPDQDSWNADGRIRLPSKIDEKFIDTLIPSGFLRPVDLLIRTGGEKRISNFLPWQLSYAEFYFSDILWPCFTSADFEDALKFYSTRQRRFGGNNSTSV